MKKLSKTDCIIILMPAILVVGSCTRYTTTGQERLRALEYINSDTSICFLPEVTIVDELFLGQLGQIISAYKNCGHCDFGVNYPRYFSIYYHGELGEGASFVFTNSAYTEELATEKNRYIGCFYYQNQLFVVDRSMANMDGVIYETTEHALPIYKCGLIVLGICFKATLKPKNGDYEIEYYCEGVTIEK